MRVAIIGSGFAGSILARVLSAQGHEVSLLDRQRHPRFALGESSTPLAAIALERLAARYGLGDLADLASYGRWRRRLPAVRCGLKRGFTFYSHSPDEPYRNGSGNERRLMVAASPDDEVADTHWMRADVDERLFRLAAAAGVGCFEGAEVAEVRRVGRGWRLDGSWQGRPLGVEADLLVDASGAGGFLAGQLGIAARPAGPAMPPTSLVYSHFDRVDSFPRVATQRGATLPPGPFPEERAAVHHLLAEGWMYVLPFDDGVVSAGVVLAESEAREWAAGRDPERAWAEILARYPTLAAQFAGSRPVRPVAFIPGLQHRLARAAGPGWALLPHAFCFLSPLFSTGIAWSLLGVERLALLLEPAVGVSRLPGRGLGRYNSLLQREADHLERLVGGAYRAMERGFDVFAAWGDLYFAAASFSEMSQRLLDAPADGWAWEGFLGSGDPMLRAAIGRSLTELMAFSVGAVEGGPLHRFAARIGRRIASRNVVGLGDPARNRLFPVDLEPLRRSAGLLGLTAAELEARLPRLRGLLGSNPHSE